MSDLTEKAATARALMERSAQNPSVAPGKPARERNRIPLSVPERKLEVPGIPGYYLRWFRGTAQRLAQAERAGFEFVTPEEVQLNNVSMGGDARKDGNTDLGSRVSVVEGGEVDGGGQAVRLYLMKQKLEYKKEDDAVIQARNDKTVQALTASFRAGSTGGQAAGETAEDMQHRYVDPKRTKIPEFFRKKTPRN